MTVSPFATDAPLTWLERFEGGGVARERLHVFLLRKFALCDDDDDDDDARNYKM